MTEDRVPLILATSLSSALFSDDGMSAVSSAMDLLCACRDRMLCTACASGLLLAAGAARVRLDGRLPFLPALPSVFPMFLDAAPSWRAPFAACGPTHRGRALMHQR